MSNIDKQAHKMRNYLNTAVISGMKLLHLTTDELSALLDELEDKDKQIAEHNFENRLLANADRDIKALRQRIAELESRTVKLPDGWQFEECEIEGCENGAIFSVGTGSRNIHLCDKCAHEPQNSRLKKSPLSKRLPFKMSSGIITKVGE